MVALKYPLSYIWQTIWALTYFSYLGSAANGSVNTDSFDPFTTELTTTLVYDDQCPELPEINDTEPVQPLPGPPYPVGTNITLKCKPGFLPEMGRTTVAMCRLNDGVASWIMPTLECYPVSCPEPPAVENGNRHGYVYTFPNAVNYTCNVGYELVGVKTIYCSSSGEWTSKPPKCIKVKCPQPRPIQNGTLDVPSLEFNAKITYKCNHGFKLEGLPVRRCLANKTWSDEEPKCVEFRCRIPPNFHGRTILVGPGGDRPGGRTIFSCGKETYTLGCTATGEWSGTIKPCPAPGPSEPPRPTVPYGCKFDKDFRNGKFNASLPSNDHFLFDTHLKFECNSGYKLEGKSVSVCQKNTTWMPPIPKCKKSFPTTIVVIVAVVVGVVLAVVCGVIQWCRYRRRRKPERNMGTISKARLSDARDYEETKKLGKEKAIPVTVL